MDLLNKLHICAVLLAIVGAGCAELPESEDEAAPVTAPLADARSGKAFWAVPDAEPGPFLRPRFISRMSPIEAAAPYRAELFVVLGQHDCGSGGNCFEVRFASGRVAYIFAKDFDEAYIADPTIGRLQEGGLIAPDDPQSMASRINVKESRRIEAAQARAKGLGVFSAIYENGLGLTPALSSEP